MQTPVTVSILMPVYNEETLIAPVLERVVTAPAAYFEAAGIRPELVVVDDGSRDASCAAIEAFLTRSKGIAGRLIRHTHNQGKGAAIRTALLHARGEFCIIQDADLEYDPADYPSLLLPLLDGEADLVLGSRFLAGPERHGLAGSQRDGDAGSQRHGMNFWHTLANRSITKFAALASHLVLTDVETGYKAFRTALVKSIPLRNTGFGLDPELVIKVSKRQAVITEVPITYRGRTAEQGKKIRAHHAAAALWAILRAAFSSDIYSDPGAAILDVMSGANRFNRWMADTLMPFIHGDVFELGAGIGNLTTLLCPASDRYIATDIDNELLRRLKARVRACNLITATCDLTDASAFKTWHNSIDTVVCLNVLEHVEHDLTALANIYSCLKPGGRALILVPQGMQAFGSLDEVLQHCRRYSKMELQTKMTAVGFTVKHVLNFNRATYPGWFLNSRVLRRRTLSRVQLRLFDSFVPLLRHIDRFLPWPPTSIIGIGVREN